MPDHSLSDMQCTVIEQPVIEQLHTASVSIRQRREKFWRHQLQTNYPDGLNVFLLERDLDRMMYPAEESLMEKLGGKVFEY
jgi:hypothetical protein